MFNNVARKLAFGLFLVVLTGSAGRAFAASSGQTSSPSTTPTTFLTSTSNGITGTDPEPIDPGIVSILLTLLELG